MAACVRLPGIRLTTIYATSATTTVHLLLLFPSLPSFAFTSFSFAPLRSDLLGSALSRLPKTGTREARILSTRMPGSEKYEILDPRVSRLFSRITNEVHNRARQGNSREKERWRTARLSDERLPIAPWPSNEDACYRRYRLSSACCKTDVQQRPSCFVLFAPSFRGKPRRERANYLGRVYQLTGSSCADFITPSVCATRFLAKRSQAFPVTGNFARSPPISCHESVSNFSTFESASSRFLDTLPSSLSRRSVSTRG
ncbi:hypothetical protein DBV15_06353 [Temnothorax longispinosus]|uniref:Uncharacterized protein n=1 Tax=Temnothorax longispinosus TaxID=300112 RepID=A0A4S2L305_9HYME|nr:hypothetical protein DBV15_06353 [Temnothorax longispinosus]